jgi:hypothetical protein
MENAFSRAVLLACSMLRGKRKRRDAAISGQDRIIVRRRMNASCCNEVRASASMRDGPRPNQHGRATGVGPASGSNVDRHAAVKSECDNVD